MHGLRLRNGLVVLAGQSGNFFVSRDQGQTFDLWRPGGSEGVASLFKTADGSLLAAGRERPAPHSRAVPQSTVSTPTP
jgi:photosystem II stability/assembly factor-like uncharacterized protein